MEQAKRTRAHLERVLIVCGEPNAGKSHVLRDMFQDPRLGTKCAIPKHSRIGEVALSQERCLAFRLSSPHEANDNVKEFLDELDRAMKHASKKFWRFNYALAMQPLASKRMPDAVDAVKSLILAFRPERIRLAQISSRQDGTAALPLSEKHVDQLRKMNVEFCSIDARKAAGLNPNGFFLADFFDFT